MGRGGGKQASEHTVNAQESLWVHSKFQNHGFAHLNLARTLPLDVVEPSKLPFIWCWAFSLSLSC